MTRETKMGLLIGLGVIVVFAVLLSHNQPVGPPGDGLPLVINRSVGVPNRLAASEDQKSVRPTPAGSEPMKFVDSSSLDLVEPSVTEKTLVEKLRPKAFELTDEEKKSPAEVAALKSTAATVSEPVATAQGSRTAPVHLLTLNPPQPSVRTELPKQTELAQPVPAPQTLADAGRTAPPDPVKPVREYVIHAGDTLGQIAEKEYGTSRGGVLEYLIKVNKDRIKDKHSVVAGQTLQIPALPPEMFEKVASITGVKVKNLADTADLDALVNDTKPKVEQKTEKQAPPLTQLVKISKDASVDDNPADEETAAYRLHEVKANDTYSSISRQYFGTSKYWQTIKELNKDVDPRKMKPGTKLRLPKKPPASKPLTSRQASA